MNKSRFPFIPEKSASVVKAMPIPRVFKASFRPELDSYLNLGIAIGFAVKTASE
jgi:hypothetical protein